VWIGRNRDVSWGITASALGQSDELVITEQQQNAGLLLDVQSSASPSHSAAKHTVREEVIHVRGEEPLLHRAVRGAEGPVIYRSPSSTQALGSNDVNAGTSDVALDHAQSFMLPTVSSALASHMPEWRDIELRSAALRPLMSISFLRKINQATNFEDFSVAAQLCAQLPLNYVYGDTQGNIGLVEAVTRLSPLIYIIPINFIN
jgi:acyl-homoserine lactone acylase PvdQ